MEQVADRLVVEVQRMLSQTGADKIHLIGHSLGGVVIAQAIAGGRLAAKVDTIVTLGAPFGGSPWGVSCAIRGDCPGAAGKVRHSCADSAPRHTRRRAVAGNQRHIRHGRTRRPGGARPSRSGDHDNRRRRPPRNAPEPAGCRKHRRRIARKSPTKTTHLIDSQRLSTGRQPVLDGMTREAERRR